MNATSMIFAGAMLSAAAATAFAASAAGPEETGVAFVEPGSQFMVVDGDTLQVEGHVLRLAGIDAPEIGQLCGREGDMWPCGLQSAYALRKVLALEKRVACRVTAAHPVDTAVCSVGNEDLGAMLVSSGRAMVAADADLQYQLQQDTARRAGLGVWSGPVLHPAVWLEGKRLPGEASATTMVPAPHALFNPAVPYAGCVIRAHETANGERVFATPLDAGYKHFDTDRTFCGIDQAERDGWLHVGQTVAPSLASQIH